MTKGWYRLLVILFWGGVVLLDRLWHVALFSLLPLLVLAPLLLAWQPRHTERRLVGWGIVALLFSTTSPLVIGGVTIIPWLIRRLVRHVSVDVSLTFFGVLLLTVGLQTALIFGWSAPPWALVIPMIVLVTSTAFAALVTREQLAPHVWA